MPAASEHPGTIDNCFLGDVADEHILMESRVSLARASRTMTPTSTLDTGGNYLQSIIQRDDESAWQWEDGGVAIPMWSARAISEMLGTPDLRVLPTDSNGHGTLYRRVMPDHLTREESVRWHPVATLRGEYGGRKNEDVAGFDSFVRDALLRADVTIRRACTFVCTDGRVRVEYEPETGEWLLTQEREGWMRETKTAGDTLLHGGRAEHPGWGRAYIDERRSDGTEEFAPVPADRVRDLDTPTTYAVETGVSVAEATALATRAGVILRDWVDGDAKSWTNLKLSMAAPFLRSHSEKAYVWQGSGGTGKSTLAGDLMRHLGDQACTYALDLLCQPTALSAENGMLDLTEHLLALSDDYDPRYNRFKRILPNFKILLTGILPFAARRQGENAVVGRPQAVHLLTTNYHLPISEQESEQRRFAFATINNRMVREKEYLPFLKEHGFWPFMLCSALTWVRRQGAHCYGVAFMDRDNLSDEEIDAINDILDKGFTVPLPGVRVDWQGIGAHRTSTRKGFDDGRSHPVYRASKPGEELYDVWCAAVQAVRDIGCDDPKPVPVPDGASVADVTTVDEWAMLLAPAKPRLFPCWDRDTPDPNRPDRTHTAKSPNGGLLHRLTGEWSWQKAAANPGLDLSHTNDPDWPAWGMTMDSRYLWLDLDRHSDMPAGWERIQTEVAPYGTADLPRTWAVETPSGGLHLLYRMPDGVMVRTRAGGPLQVDTRAGGTGYVVAACSRTESGVYRPVDRPDGDRIPVLSDALLAWLDRNGYVEHPDGPSSGGMPSAPSPVPPSDDAGRPHDPFAGMGLPVPSSARPVDVRRDGPRTVNPPVMGRGATHDAWRDWCYGIAMRAVEQGWSANAVRDAFAQGLRSVPASHDRTDTLRCIADACRKAGIQPPDL